MEIGNVKLENNIFLAPMAGVTDLPFRIICKEMGAGLVYSEMVSAKGIMYDNENTTKLLEVDEREKPVSVQLFGHEPKVLASMAKKIEGYNHSIIDINMGCPAPKVVKNNEGSALMKTPTLIGEIVKALVDIQKKPVTIKFRKGFENSANAVEVAKIAEKNGASAVAVHGRTREEYYSGKADWDIIKEVKRSVNIPVIGSGDIFTPNDAQEMIKTTGCDAVMIARGAQGNPWIFKRTIHLLNTGELIPEPSEEEKIDMALTHAKLLIDYKGEYIGVREMRRHMSDYIKGIKGAAAMRVELNKALSLSDFWKILKRA